MKIDRLEAIRHIAEITTKTNQVLTGEYIPELLKLIERQQKIIGIAIERHDLILKSRKAVLNHESWEKLACLGQALGRVDDRLAEVVKEWKEAAE